MSKAEACPLYAISGCLNMMPGRAVKCCYRKFRLASGRVAVARLSDNSYGVLFKRLMRHGEFGLLQHMP